MLPYERQAHLLELFHAGTVVSPEDIMRTFQVSIATARRDLNCLEERGTVKKVYGGAVLATEDAQDAPLKERMLLHQARKEAIGRACADMVSDGDFILLDCGTTARYAAMHMKSKKNLTVITNSVLVMNELMNSEVSVIVLGGQLRRGELSLVGPDTIHALDSYQVPKCFISASGLSLAYGFSDYVQDEIEVKKKAIQRARQVVMMADSSKFSSAAPRCLCALEEADAIVTDAALDPEIAAQYRAAGCHLILAE